MTSSARATPLPNAVLQTLGKRGIPFDSGCNEHSEFLAGIAQVATQVYDAYATAPLDLQLYRSYRPGAERLRLNEVSTLLKLLVEQAAGSLQLHGISEFSRLGASGYPDFVVVHRTGLHAYLDINATTRPGTGSARDFYFTPLEETRRKITEDGLHLLLGFTLRQVNEAAYVITGWKLVDLSKITVKFEPEFNADNRELYRDETIIDQRPRQG